MTISYFFKSLKGSYALPPLSDLRWRVFLLLGSYLIAGILFLGFDRKPEQIVILILAGGLLDMLLMSIFKKIKAFPLSAMISCCSLALILNWSYDASNLLLPVFVCMISKYVFTLNGRHFFNPSLFAIVFCILFADDFISLAPSYQWYGTANTAWMMMWFLLTGALMLFVFKINRHWLILSFLITFALQTLLRGIIMEHIIPWQTLVIGSLTSPAFYLFTFYMITDPATSPKDKKSQIIVGISIGILDLLFHLKLSYYTFFFAGFTVAAVRYLIALYTQWRGMSSVDLWNNFRFNIPRYSTALLFSMPIFLFYNYKFSESKEGKQEFYLNRIEANHSGLGGEKSKLLEEVDTRVAHVAKWIISVGDAAAVADVDLDGYPDIFLTQPLKDVSWRGKLYLNQKDFKFKKVEIPALEKYLSDPKKYGIPGFAFFYDMDNDGDKDLFTGFGFGPSHLFENKIIPEGKLSFVEKEVPYLRDSNTICLSANALDFNNDGYLDLLINNTLVNYLPQYETATPLNIFNLPQPQYPGDRRMFHFMHESWQNANNGGLNHLLLYDSKQQNYTDIPAEQSGLIETRWSLASTTTDINNDGFTDLYIANDFGRDDCYLNDGGKKFVRQQGKFYGDLGLDTYKGMNATAADFDGDGKEDIYVSNVHHAMQAEGSLLWLNKTSTQDTQAHFLEAATRMNALNTHRFGWGAAACDINLDGWQDLIQANGMTDDSWDKKYAKREDYWYYQAQIARTGPEIHSYADKWADIRGCSIYENEPDRIMLNHQGQSFNDVATAVGFGHLKNTRGVVAADFDNDGDDDLLVTDQYGAPILYRNDIIKKYWIGLRLVGNGNETARDAVGTKVWLSYESNNKKVIQYREQKLVNGFMAMGDTRMLFGLGNKKNIVQNIRLKIQWHNGYLEEIKISGLNQYYQIKMK